MRSLPWFLPILTVCCQARAGEGPPFGFKDHLLVPVRVHLMGSVENPELRTSLGSKDVERIFQKVNRVWSQAGIQFYLEPLVNEAAVQPAADGKPAVPITLSTVPAYLPPATRATEAFNVYYIKSFEVNGVYHSHPEAIIVKDTASLRPVEGGIDEPLPRVTSHELGHAFSLVHRQDNFNLMASGTTGTTLNEAEIKQARESAAKRSWILPAPKCLEKAVALEKEGKAAEALPVYRWLSMLPVEAGLEVQMAQQKVKDAPPEATPAPAPPAPGAPDPDSLAQWRERMQGIIPRGYVCGFTATPLQVDGKMDDAAWADAPWTEDFVDIEGDAKPKPRFRTRAKMLWDEQFLYIAAEMEEPHVWGTLTKHDSVIFYDPDFEVFIDPDGDSHEYYEFEMNALNTGWDLFLPKPYKDGGGADDSWSIPGLKTAVHVRGTLNDPSDKDEGWDLEIAIPWSVLGAKANRAAPPAEGDQWRVGFSRVEWQITTEGGKYQKVPNAPENNWIWSPQGVVDMHRPERWGYVQFTRKKDTPFVPDPSYAARTALQEIYYAQRAFKKKNGSWSAVPADLGISARPPLALPSLRLMPDGWEAELEFPVTGSTLQKLKIRQDALIRPVK